MQSEWWRGLCFRLFYCNCSGHRMSLQWKTWKMMGIAEQMEKKEKKFPSIPLFPSVPYSLFRSPWAVTFYFSAELFRFVVSKLWQHLAECADEFLRHQFDSMCGWFLQWKWRFIDQCSIKMKYDSTEYRKRHSKWAVVNYRIRLTFPHCKIASSLLTICNQRSPSFCWNAYPELSATPETGTA